MRQDGSTYSGNEADGRGAVHGPFVREEILKAVCTPECHRFAESSCPFLPSEKHTCPRVREFTGHRP